MILYPNPAKDEVTVETHGDVMILSNKGQTIKIIKNVNCVKTLDVSDLESGIYYLKSATSTQKRIIE